ncbi:MAG: nuclear transport factor 2 family protein [Rubrivivax sp.]
MEHKFWQSIVDNDSQAAIDLLCEPAVMIGEHGTMKFDHERYRQMAEQGPMVLTWFQLSDFDVTFPNDKTAVLTYHARQTMAPRGHDGPGVAQEMNDSSTWIREGRSWRCVMHTETPANGADEQRH